VVHVLSVRHNIAILFMIKLIKNLTCLLCCAVISSCNLNVDAQSGYTPQPGFEEYQKKEFLRGKRSAKQDLKNGILGFEDINGGEEERWQVIWCYRNLLKDRYGIDYRCSGTLPGPIAYAAGYQSVTRPIIDSKLGSGWEDRVFREAEEFHQNHWSEVEHLYHQEKRSGR
jgi:hypothetical protein